MQAQGGRFLVKGLLSAAGNRGTTQRLATALTREHSSRSEATSPGDGPSTSGRSQVAMSGKWLLLSAAVLGLGGAGSSLLQDGIQDANAKPLGTARSSAGVGIKEAAWVCALAEGAGTEEVLSAASMHQHPLLKRDHMFSALHRHEMVEDLICFYNADSRSLSYVIQLGSDVCGYPKIVHGGLTAAIIDESFGFLFLSLRSRRQLPFIGPAFTAHLEVDYKAKIQAGTLLLCTTEVESAEGRKLWMRATMRDGGGKVYATARALFVAPTTSRLVKDGLRYALHAVLPSKVSLS